jgi:hypothetical protein
MSSTFDWSKFQKAPPVETPAPSNNGFDWNQFKKEAPEPQAEEKPSFLQNIASLAGKAVMTNPRLAARAAETAISLPRELGEFGQSLVPEKAILAGAEKVGLKEGAENLLNLSKKYAPYKLFPSTEQAKKFTKDLFGEHLEPKSEFAKIQDEVVSDLTSLAIPVGGPLKVARPLLTALGSQFAKQGVKWFGGGETWQNLAKIGSVGLSAFIRPGEAKKVGDSLFKAARNSRPQNATVSSSTLETTLNNLEADLRRSGVAASGKESLQKIADIRSEIQGAQIPVEALETAKIKINEARAGLFNAVELQGNKPGVKTAHRNLNNVSKAVDETLDIYGKYNPTWESFYRPANEVHGAIANSQKFRRWITKNYKALSLPSVAALFGLKTALGPAGTIATGALGATGVIAGEGMAKVIKSPTLQKYFREVISSALAEDLPKFTAASKKLEIGLDKQASREEPKQ